MSRSPSTQTSTHDQDQEQDMGFKGTFSYKNETVNAFLVIDGIDLVVQKLNVNVGRIMFVSRTNGKKISMRRVGEVILMTAGDEQIQPIRNEFLITWVDSYTMTINGTPVFQLFNQKQQAIRTIFEKSDRQWNNQNQESANDNEDQD